MKKIIASIVLVSAVASAQSTTQQTITATNTSTTTTAEVKPAAKKFSVSFSSVADVDASESRTAAAAIATENTIGASYKVAPKTSIGLAHMFNAQKSGINSDDASRNSFAKDALQSALTSLTVSQMMPSLLKSDEWSLAGGLTVITGNGPSVASMIAADVKQYAQVTASIGWTLNPKLNLSLTEQFRSYFTSNSTVGSAVSHRILNIGNAEYSITDKFSVYQSLGTITGFHDRFDMRKTRDRAYIESGVNFNPNKQISLNLNINQDKQITSSASSSLDTSNFVLFRPYADSSVQYELAASLKF